MINPCLTQSGRAFSFKFILQHWQSRRQFLSGMESCVDESQAALASLSQGGNLSRQDVVAILLMLRHNTRLLYQSSHAGRQQIYHARAVFDSTCLEKDAYVYERRYLEEEMSRC